MSSLWQDMSGRPTRGPPRPPCGRPALTRLAAPDSTGEKSCAPGGALRAWKAAPGGAAFDFLAHFSEQPAEVEGR